MDTRQLARIMRGLTASALLLALTASPVLALDARAGDTIAVADGEEVDEDLYLAGRTVTCNGDIGADVFAAGQTITVGGDIANGITGAGQTIVINGDVGHGARLAGNTIDVTGRVGRDVLVAGATVTIAAGAEIVDDLYLAANQAVVDGEIGGNLKGGCEHLFIGGTVAGDVQIEVAQLTIQPGARIDGNLTYTAQDEAEIPAGTVMGDVQFTQRTRNEAEGAARGLEALAPFLFFAGLTWKIITFLMALITGIVLILVWPGAMAATSDAIRTRTGPVAGWGAIGLFVTPIAAIVVCLTVVGLPLGLITLVLWGILLYLSQLPVALVIGHLILSHSRPLEGTGLMIGSLALGLLILELIKAIPFIGFLVSIAIALFGIGAYVVVEWRMMKMLRTGGWEHQP